MNSETEVTNNDSFESVCKRFIDCRNACPVFFAGSLQNACRSAFNSTIIKERRPLLIYIHHDTSMWNNMFCLTILIDYLRENYVVWPWDVTLESNRNILIQIWKEMFSSEFFIDFSMIQYPMLIGIMRRSSREKDSFSEFQYQSKVLLKDDTLMYTHRKLNLETLLDQLVAFKENFDANEQSLSFDFARKTGFSWEIILEITEYLSLNDAVTVFSTDILPLLWKHRIRLSIVEPSVEFMETMLEKIDREHIVSLRLKAAQLKSTLELASSTTFNNITSLTLVNLEDMKQISEYKTCFLKLTCLSLQYDNEVDFHSLCKIFSRIQSPLKRFEIHCNHIRCSHRHIRHIFSMINKLNDTIEYFLLAVADISMESNNRCSQYYETCFLKSTTDFIQIMSNIRSVRLIINNGNVEKLLDVNEWKSLVKMRHQLKKVTLQLVGNQLKDERIIQKILEIQKELYNVRDTIEFRVIFK